MEASLEVRVKVSPEVYVESSEEVCAEALLVRMEGAHGSSCGSVTGSVRGSVLELPVEALPVVCVKALPEVRIKALMEVCVKVSQEVRIKAVLVKRMEALSKVDVKALQEVYVDYSGLDEPSTSDCSSHEMGTQKNSFRLFY